MARGMVRYRYFKRHSVFGDDTHCFICSSGITVGYVSADNARSLNFRNFLREMHSASTLLQPFIWKLLNEDPSISDLVNYVAYLSSFEYAPSTVKFYLLGLSHWLRLNQCRTLPSHSLYKKCLKVWIDCNAVLISVPRIFVI
jgi:hypothetical protein